MNTDSYPEQAESTWYTVSEFMAATDPRTCVECAQPERAGQVIRDADEHEGGAEFFIMHERCQSEPCEDGV